MIALVSSCPASDFVNASPDESREYVCCGVSTYAFSNALEGSASPVEANGFVHIIRDSTMFERVLLGREYCQVIDAVVGLPLVPVMNLFVRPKPPPQVLFHDMPVRVDESVSYCEKPVALDVVLSFTSWNGSGRATVATIEDGIASASGSTLVDGFLGLVETIPAVGACDFGHISILPAGNLKVKSLTHARP